METNKDIQNVNSCGIFISVCARLDISPGHGKSLHIFDCVSFSHPTHAHTSYPGTCTTEHARVRVCELASSPSLVQLVGHCPQSLHSPIEILPKNTPTFSQISANQVTFCYVFSVLKQVFVRGFLSRCLLI